jgi:hypothetical protein
MAAHTRRTTAARRMRWVVLLVAVAGVSADSGQALDEPPYSCFVIHCEPTRANEPMFDALVELVETASSYHVRLTIDVAPQWAEMILADPAKVSSVASWVDAGHEIGCHHHPYWSTKDRPASWDGYTNTPVADLPLRDREQRLGDMEDYMKLLNALSGVRTSACMGLEAERDRADWPCQLRYGTVGYSLDDAVSEPQLALYGDCAVY